MKVSLRYPLFDYSEGPRQLGLPLLGRTPRGRATTCLLRRALRRVLETAFEKVLRRDLRRCLAVGFRGRKGLFFREGT